MKKIFLAIATVMLTAGVFASCEKLDLQPQSETSLMEDDVFSTYDGYHGFFLKLYSSMAVAGQGGDGGNDVSWDGGRSVYLRSLYWVQECPTDIVITRTGNGYQIPQTVSLDWTTGSEFPKYLYYLMSLLDLDSYNEGTTIPSLRTETLNRLEFDIPELDYQKRVLSMLEPIDERIKLNTEINENLAA